MMKQNILTSVKTLCAGSLLLALVACGSTPNNPKDPWEGMNRATHSFNMTVDDYLLEPIARGYVAVMPEVGQQGVHNVLNNLSMPWVMLNSVLQADAQNSFSAFWSFILNSTFGVAGVFDFTGANTDLRVNQEDFGQTLGVWGLGSGNYVVLPLFGPSNVRDTFGRITDVFLDPFNYAKSDEFIITRTVLSAIDTRAGLLDAIDDVKKNSLDSYATMRSAYTQKRIADVAR